MYYNRLVDYILRTRLLNQAELARQMYPKDKNPQRKLNAKLHNGKINGAIQVMSPKDYMLAERVLMKLSNELRANIELNDGKNIPDSDLIL